MRFLLPKLFALTAVGAALGALSASPVQAYSPTHEKVQAMVQKARQYLATAEPGSMGEQAVVALGLVKSGSDDSDPQVQKAIAKIRAGIQKESNLGSPINYHVALSIIFLLETDPVKYRSETQSLLDVLLRRQEKHGGWSYWPGEGGYSRAEGDSSMSQYGTLALWGAKRAGFNVPQEACERLINFWIRTQTPQGAWGYQGRLAPSGQRQAQEDIRPSLVLGGAGSSYILGELFGLANERKESSSGLPSALQKVSQQNARYFTARDVNLGELRQTLSLADRHIAQMHKRYEGAGERFPWIQVFYMYSMERYQSFRELYSGKTEQNPKWYDDGVEFLEKTQQPAGSWNFGRSAVYETPFAVMFLVRSTQKTIDREFGDGLVRGGRGLPSDISRVAIDEATGAVINPETAGTVAMLMSILEDPSNGDFDSVTANPTALVEGLLRPTEDEDQVAREQRIQRLKDMVSQGTYQQRLIAVKALSRTGDLDQAPLLLYALTDPDPRVVREADAGLRFISRKFSGFGPPDAENPKQREKVRLQWRNWYLALRPGAELLD